ncbi:uncharacterized protein TrAFT101_001595 [Trichoderma asperellum]|uniref:uncharacterized protein n=1 Tax=Trichoderma asperellum TaxID=101201 RepID=UPI00332475E3|nr:hypothetical protein TrAFT101_001595 [Trichoderma asperellum]
MTRTGALVYEKLTSTSTLKIEAEKCIPAEKRAGNIGWFQNLANGITTEYLHRNDIARFVQVAAIRSNLTCSFTKSLA